MTHGQSENIGLRNFCFTLLILSLFGAVLMPSLTIFNSFPKIEISDITCGVLLLITIYNYKEEVLSFIIENRKWLSLFSLFIVITIVSIIWAGRYFILRDWFEPLKYLKMLSFVLFFYLYTDIRKWKFYIEIIFLGLVFFNILHYYNIWNFNLLIEPFYTASHHLNNFGLNSIGEEATKRMIGTMGNPNNNAVLFVVFTMLFLPRKRKNMMFHIFFSCVAMIGVFACQSRTGFVCLAVLMTFYFIFILPGWKIFFVFLSTGLLAFLLFQSTGNNYISSITSSKQLAKASDGRVVQWEKIIEYTEGKEMLGNGVNKQFMQKNKLYAESEYFLLYFRYGLLGLVAFISVYVALFFKNITNYKVRGTSMILGIIIIFSIAGITNAPLHSNKLSFIFAMIIGVALLLTERLKVINA
ncbi:MAG: O-antigen ligase family protein [Lishizhenia sp.]